MMDAQTFASRIAEHDAQQLAGMVAMMKDVIAEGGPLAETYREALPSIQATIARKTSATVNSVDDLPRSYGSGSGSARTARPAVRLASDKQLAFIRKLLGEKDLTGTAFTAWTDETPASLDSKTASASIDSLLALPRKQVARQATSTVELAAGAYRVEGRIVRVYLGQQSRKMLAQELVDPTARTRDEAWKYLGMASRFVPADAHRMTVDECEQASAGTEDHGWCCVCGRELDDPKSVARGIGPVCRAKQG